MASKEWAIFVCQGETQIVFAHGVSLALRLSDSLLQFNFLSQRKSSGERKELWLQWFYKPLQILFKGLLYLYNNIPTAENKCQLNLLLGFISHMKGFSIFLENFNKNLQFHRPFLKGLIRILEKPKMSKSYRYSNLIMSNDNEFLNFVLSNGQRPWFSIFFIWHSKLLARPFFSNFVSPWIHSGAHSILLLSWNSLKSRMTVFFCIWYSEHPLCTNSVFCSQYITVTCDPNSVGGRQKTIMPWVSNITKPNILKKA